MRCNCGIDPKNLTDEHLFAESRELKMIPSLFKRIGMGSLSKAPKRFKLGDGHMLFLTYKPTYTLRRYKMVLEECVRRGMHVQDESCRWEIYGALGGDFEETDRERKMLIDRISEHVINSPKEYFHYDHIRISKFEAIRLLSR